MLSISQRTLAQQLGISQAQLWRIEGGQSADLGLTRLSEIASLLGLEPSLTLHPLGDPIHDRGQQAVGRRFDAVLSAAWQVTSEALLPVPGDLRSWDRLLRLRDATDRHVIGADLETRIRDVQALVRRTRLRERDGGVEAILIVLSDSAVNRRLVEQLREALGPSYMSGNRTLIHALRTGRPLPGSGVILL